MADVKLPGVGNVDSKWVWAGGALIVGIVGFAYIRNRSVSASVTEEPAGDESAVTSDYADYSNLYGDAYATDYAYDGGYPSYYPSYYEPAYGQNTTVQTADPVTNSEWTQRSIEHLELVGIESGAASLAVSRFLLKECLTAAQADIVRQAIAAVSNPPQGNFSIIVCPTNTPTTPGGGSSTATGQGPVKGLKAAGTYTQHVTLDWSPVSGAKGYTVYRNGSRVLTVLYSTATVWGLRKNTKYTFKVVPVRSDGKAGTGASISVRTKKK
jgi:hypothetical protein